MKGPNPRRLWTYVTRCLGLQSYFRSPGDGRPQPQIPAKALLWSLLIGQVLRACSFLAVERLVRSSARRALAVSRPFSDDALDYFTERLNPTFTRAALARVLHQAKRNKAFETSGGIGLAVDGTTVGWCASSGCSLCRPYRNADQEIAGYRHHVVLASVVGTGLSLPFDVKPYGTGDSEYAAGQRLLRRAVEQLGVRFAAYVVVDGEFATAPFLHTASDLGLPIVARLKANLPELLAAAQKRFRSQPPKLTFPHGSDRVELWDAEDFDPWENLHWESVRVLFYRQQKPDGEVIEAFWLTDSPIAKVSSRVLYHRAKSRWEIENQGFNDAKNRYDLEHICHHHSNSLLNHLAAHQLGANHRAAIPRLRYLRRGKHPPRTATDFVHLLWLSLSPPASHDSS
jgi:hypothetical protein